MKAVAIFLLSCLPALSQVTKPVQVYSTSGQLQWPPSFFMTNVFAAGGTTLSFDSLGRMTISSVSGSGTNLLVQTNGVSVGSAGTINYTTGVTGYISAGVLHLGVVPSGGSVTTAELLVVSNITITASNYFENKIVATSNKFVPGGITGSVQYRNASAGFAGSADLTYDDTAKQLTLASTTFPYLSVGFANAAGGSNIFYPQGMIYTPAGGLNANSSIEILLRNALFAGSVFGLYIRTNKLIPASGSNAMDFGSITATWGSNFNETVIANQRVKLGNTNNDSGTIFSTWHGPNRPTNDFVFHVTNAVAGQSLKINNVTYSGGRAIIVVTNE